MFCHVKQRSFADFSTSLGATVIRDRIPHMGALELTYRCNQSCRHCYCNLGLDDSRKRDELTTIEVKRILDEVAEAGCLWILLTGGEVLVREDFADIYLHAVRRGMIVEVFTNATLIDDKIAALFGEFHAIRVDISIYGSNPALHDSVTGVEGSFARTMAGIRRLKEHKVKFSLKTILMTLNHHDLKAMQDFAAGLGAKFHFDSLISPRTDGGTSPLEYRLDIDRMVGLDIDTEEDFKVCEDIFNGFWNKQLGEALHCGAGVFAFNINPYGVLSPCTMFSSHQYPLKTASFGSAWKRMAEEYGSGQNDFIPEECRSCTMLFLCPRCAAWAETEAGSARKSVAHLCEYAKNLERKFLKKKEERREKETVSKT